MEIIAARVKDAASSDSVSAREVGVAVCREPAVDAVAGDYGARVECKLGVEAWLWLCRLRQLAMAGAVRRRVAGVELEEDVVAVIVPGVAEEDEEAPRRLQCRGRGWGSNVEHRRGRCSGERLHVGKLPSLLRSCGEVVRCGGAGCRATSPLSNS